MSVYLKFHGCNMEVVSDREDFLNFVKTNYYLFLSEKHEKSDLTCQIFFREGKIEDAPVRISGRATIGPHCLVYNDPPLSICFDSKTNTFTCYFKPGFLKHFARLLIRGKDRRKFDYFEYLVQKMIRYPLFYFMESNGAQFHHSSCIEKDGSAFLFMGFDKVGKSTTALKMLAKGYHIMSDNFTMIRNNTAHPYLRGVRATEFVRDNLPFLKFENLKIEGNKYKVLLDRSNFCFKPTKIKKLFFFRRGKGFKCEKISQKTAMEQMLDISNFSLEYPHHHYVTLIPFLTKESIALNRIKRYEELSKIPAFNVEYSNFKDIEKIEKWCH